MRECLMAMMILMLVILMLTLLLLNLNTSYADTCANLCIRMLSLCCILCLYEWLTYKVVFKKKRIFNIFSPKYLLFYTCSKLSDDITCICIEKISVCKQSLNFESVFISEHIRWAEKRHETK